MTSGSRVAAAFYRLNIKKKTSFTHGNGPLALSGFSQLMIRGELCSLLTTQMVLTSRLTLSLCNSLVMKPFEEMRSVAFIQPFKEIHHLRLFLGSIQSKSYASLPEQLQRKLQACPRKDISVLAQTQTSLYIDQINNLPKCLQCPLPSISLGDL